MNRFRFALAAVVISSGIWGAAVYAADQPNNSAMHMHKSEMNHDKPDREVAADYKSEATVLKEKSESHHKLAQQYRSRTPSKGGGSYENVAKHCDKLAEYYAQAAKEATAVADELGKQPE